MESITPAAHLQNMINGADEKELRGMLVKVSELYNKQCNTINELRFSIEQALICIEQGHPDGAVSTLKSALKNSEV